MKLIRFLFAFCTFAMMATSARGMENPQWFVESIQDSTLVKKGYCITCATQTRRFHLSKDDLDNAIKKYQLEKKKDSDLLEIMPYGETKKVQITLATAQQMLQEIRKKGKMYKIGAIVTRIGGSFLLHLCINGPQILLATAAALMWRSHFRASRHTTMGVGGIAFALSPLVWPLLPGLVLLVLFPPHKPFSSSAQPAPRKSMLKRLGESIAVSYIFSFGFW